MSSNEATEAGREDHLLKKSGDKGNEKKERVSNRRRGRQEFQPVKDEEAELFKGRVPVENTDGYED